MNVQLERWLTSFPVGEGVVRVTELGQFFWPTLYRNLLIQDRCNFAKLITSVKHTTVSNLVTIGSVGRPGEYLKCESVMSIFMLVS